MTSDSMALHLTAKHFDLCTAAHCCLLPESILTLAQPDAAIPLRCDVAITTQ